MSFVTGEFVDPTLADPDFVESYEDHSFYCQGQETDWSQMAVVGVIKTLDDPTGSGERREALDIIITPASSLADEDRAVPATRFVNDSGQFVPPETPAAFLVHLGAEAA